MANFDDSPIIITSTKVPKQKRNGDYFEFLSPNRLLLIGGILIAISMFLPYIKLTASSFGITESESLTVFQIDKFSAITACSYGFFALFAVFFESRWILIITAFDCFASTYKVLKAAFSSSHLALDFGFFQISYERTLLFGFYLYVLASILLLVGIIWKFKKEWGSSIF